MRDLIKILLASSLNLFCLSSCTSKQAWKDISSYLKEDSITMDNIRQRFSESSLKRVIQKESVDSLQEIRYFFTTLETIPFKISSKNQIIYIVFDPEKPIAGGPTLEILKKTKDFWYINDVRFGK